MDGLIVVNAIVAILGGILAASAMILARKPDAKQLIDKLTPYQALIGVGMIALGVINFLRVLRYLTSIFEVNLMYASALLGLLLTSVALGGLFGMPQIVKWIPGESSAEQKALDLTRKVGPYQGILGLIAIVASLMTLLYQFKILSWAG